MSNSFIKLTIVTFSEKPSEEDLAKRFGYEEDYYSGEDTLILKNIRMMIMTMMMIIVIIMTMMMKKSRRGLATRRITIPAGPHSKT